MRDHIRRRADEGDAGLRAGLGEFGILGEEAVSGVDGVGVGACRHIENGGDVQIAVGRRRGADRIRAVGERHVQGAGVGGGVDGDRFDTQLPAGPDDADSDLPAVGDQQSSETHRARHCIADARGA